MGEIAYAAYAKSVGGRTWDGRAMPTYAELGDVQKRGWKDAAGAVSGQLVLMLAALRKARK